MSARASNGWEHAARAKKVERILAIIPPGHLTPAGALTAVELLEAATPQERADFAALAGVKPPSDETWRMVVEMVRARQRPANTNCRAAGRDPADAIT